MNYQPIIADILTVVFTLNRDYFKKNNKRYFNYVNYLFSFSYCFV